MNNNNNNTLSSESDGKHYSRPLKREAKAVRLTPVCVGFIT
jgi:hypothetical protein